MAVNISPDRHLRKAIFDKINNIVVSGKIIPCYDSRATNAPSNYVLLTAQTKEVLKETKCDYEWETSTLIEIYTKVSSSGNTGSRVLLNDIEQAIYTLLLPKLTVQGFTNITQNITFENSLETVTDVEVIFRSFLRLNLTLK